VLRMYVLGVVAAWGAQLALVFYFLMNLTWQNYWFCRALYRPGLVLFSDLFRGILPGYFFSGVNRTGVIVQFTFATLVYAVAAVTAVAVFQWVLSSRRGRRVVRI
jgi:hypothetical protein